MRDDVRYLELKSEAGDRGPAWIARVVYSRSKRTIYFAGRALRRAAGGAVRGNHVDRRTGECFWVSGVKRDGQDRHRAGSGLVSIEASLVADYVAWTGRELEPSRHVVVDDIPLTDPAAFVAEENSPVVDRG